MVMNVFYIDSEHAKDMFQICKWLQGSMRKTWYLHQKMHASVFQPRWFSEVSGRTLNLGLKGGVRLELGGVRVVVALMTRTEAFTLLHIART